MSDRYKGFSEFCMIKGAEGNGSKIDLYNTKAIHIIYVHKYMLTHNCIDFLKRNEIRDI